LVNAAWRQANLSGARHDVKSRPQFVLYGGILLAGLVVFRWLQILPYPIGEYNWVDSPDTRNRAYVYVLIDQSFFGKTTAIYTLKVEMTTAQEQKITVFEKTIEQNEVMADFDLLDLSAVVEWSRNSRRVVYTLGGRRYEVEVPF
jgi:hypothetical protein